MAILEVRDLTVRFGETLVLDSVSFDVHEGEIFVVLGPSGCGKTTLMRAMLGLVEQTTGSVRYEGVDILTATDREKERLLARLGVLFQSGALLRSMTLGENVALPLHESTRLARESIQDVARLKLSMVGLDRSFDTMPAQLSGGMQKRGGLARAMALDPQILFFDEPSAGLDPLTSVELDEMICGLNRTLGTTMIVVTHELHSIYTIAQRAIMLDGGEKGIIAEGRPEELRDRSDDPRVRAFFRRERLDEARGSAGGG
ncbi:MAG: ATP-binding cassette domain-containing protein [Candidatus Eisenbacteria bacterium]|nr:ATP-binding cassette domain-containing protein [Candidatus Latescibacterota bacterium]MBD3303411.1 ATP-binding cassette domain-containing protein [Candidatus Eisenbacteria bacterium]